MDDVISSMSDRNALVSGGLLSHDQLQIGEIQSKRTGESLEKTLVKLGFITDALLNRAILSDSGLNDSQVINLSGVLPDPELMALIPAELAQRYLMVPVSLKHQGQNQVLTVATTDIYDLPSQDRLRAVLGERIALQLALATERDISEAIDRFYGFELSIDGILNEIETGEVDGSALTDSSEDYHQPVVRLVDAVLIDAVKHRASDIHFEPEAGFVRIRYRVDGVMRQIRSIHIDYWAAIVVRIKVLSELNIAESRAPQDGQISMHIAGGDIEFRVSCLPTIHGENVVLRVLDRQKGIVDLERLGLKEQNLEQLKNVISRPEGLILLTGPTGSGKTTTLYSMLSHKSDESINIMTLEDPVEYPMALLRQTSVNNQVKLDFSSGIKSILRQDPDVILVGEIRDNEVAAMVYRASMTGHQVYSTLHANSAVSAIDRLKDLGISAALIGGNTISIIGQRLVRRLCTSCRVIDQQGSDDVAIYKSAGCEECSGSGYNGRIAVVEVLRFTEELSQLVISGAGSYQLLECARQDNFTTLADEALRLVRSGITSMTEVMRVIEVTNTERVVR